MLQQKQQQTSQVSMIDELSDLVFFGYEVFTQVNDAITEMDIG